MILIFGDKKTSFYDKKKEFARDGDRTHAHYCELDLKSNALTTRPPWHGIKWPHSIINLTC